MERFKEIYLSRKKDVDSASNQRISMEKLAHDQEKQKQEQLENTRVLNAKRIFNQIGIVQLFDSIINNGIVVMREAVYSKGTLIKRKIAEQKPAEIRWHIKPEEKPSIELLYGYEQHHNGDTEKYIRVDDELNLIYENNEGRCSVKLSRENITDSVAIALAENIQHITYGVSQS